MSWHFTDDIDVYADQAWDLLSTAAEQVVASTIFRQRPRDRIATSGPRTYDREASVEGALSASGGRP